MVWPPRSPPRVPLSPIYCLCIKRIGGFVVFLSLLVLLKYFLGPAVGKACALGAEAAKVRRNVTTTRAALARLPQLEADATHLRDSAKDLTGRFPSESELPELLEHLSRVAEKSEVEIVEISPTRASQVDEKKGASPPVMYEELPIALIARSGYHELGSFINQLENSERIFMGKNIEIKADPSDRKRHHVQLVLETFVRGKENP